MTAFRLFQLRGLFRSRRARRPLAKTLFPPYLEQLEDRLVPSSGGATHPHTLWTYGDAYIGAPGQDRASFMARDHPVDTPPGGSYSPPALHRPPPLTDPGAPRPFPVA